MYKLSFSYDGQDFEYLINEGVTVVGRSPKCDIVMTEPSVSGRHMQFELSGGKLVCVDLGSSNGTAVNKVKIAIPTEVTPEDSLRLGRVPCQLKFDAPDTMTPTAPIIASEHTETPAHGIETPDYVEAVSPPAQEPQEQYLPAEVEERPVQVIRGGGESYPGSGANKNRLVYIVAGAGLLLLVILLLLPSTDNKPEEVITPPYGKASYLKDLDDGVDSFRNRSYRSAERKWREANDNWLEVNPGNRDYSILARELVRIAQPLSGAEKSGSYNDVDWISLSRQLRNIIDDAPMAENIRLFLESFRKQVLEESANRQTYTQGKSFYDAADYAKVIPILETIPKGSHYYNSAKDLIAQNRQADYEDSVNKLYGQAKNVNCNWVKLVEQGEIMLRLRQNAELSKVMKVWRENARDQKVVEQADRESKNKDKASLNNAEGMYKSITKGSPYYQSARTAMAELKERIINIDINTLYAAGDSSGLKDMPSKNSAIARNPRYVRMMSKVKTILKHFDTAEVMIKQQKFFSARDNWQAVIEIEPRRDNVFNVEAQAKLREWSLDRLGRDFIEKGVKARKDGKYQLARQSFETAKTRCAKDVSKEIKSLRKLAYDLYIKAQVDKSSRNIFAAKEKAMKAKSCLMPGRDELYPKVESFLRNLNSGG
ncbi:MAG: FHA domain-containing protein [Planctomycetota bacterium]|jgi:hypothetical protein